MTYSDARTKFEEAKNSGENQATIAIAMGLEMLARAIEKDIKDLDRDLQTIKNKVNSIR